MTNSVTKDHVSENVPIDVENLEVPEQGEENISSPLERKRRRKTSDVWTHVKRIKLKENGVEIEKYKCCHCSSTFKISSDGTTSHIKRHVKICVGLLGAKQMRLPFAPTTNIIGGSSVEENYLKRVSSGYSQIVVREVLAKMMMVHEYPFSMIEHPWFNIYSRVLNPRFERISRNTIKSDIMKVYESEKNELRLLMQGASRISLTSDLWTSNQNIGYMSLTAHFVDSEWILQKRIINFCQLEPPHTGVAISDAIIECLIAWGIESKVSTITLDNATANDVAAKTLMSNFQVREKLFFKGHIFHVRCCAHILNLVVQDGLRVIQHVIENVRCSVTYLKKSPSRLYKFGEIARQLSVSTSKGLALDVVTRWNSTYIMLDHALVYKSVFEQYATRDANYKWLPSDEDWFKAKEVHKFLQKFYDVTKVISGSSYPTANIFLVYLSKVKETLNKESNSEFDFMKSMAVEMRKKFDKYWGECDVLLAVAAVLDPRYKMKLVNFYFPRIYSYPEDQQNILKVQNVLHEIYDSYVAESVSSATNVDGSCPEKINVGDGNESDTLEDFDNFLDSSDATQPLKSELDIYLEEQTIRSKEFDALEWWKLNIMKFPILSKMAKDILSIPVTTVSSESAFSAGGRVLNDFRSSLSPETVEAVICGGNWIRESRKNQINSSTNTNLEMENVFVKIPDTV